MPTRRIRFQLIVFVIITLIALTTLGWYYLRLPTLAGVGQYKVFVNLPTSGGLYASSNVTYRGATVGKVTDVLRIAGAHGMDDPFYKDRYGAKVWALEGHRYTPGFTRSEDVYFEPDATMGPGTELPVAGARLHMFRSKPPEALLVLERHGGTVVAGDCLQNWASSDRFFSLGAKVMMPFMGFIKPKNVGPAWYKNAKPGPDNFCTNANPGVSKSFFDTF